MSRVALLHIGNLGLAFREILPFWRFFAGRGCIFLNVSPGRELHKVSCSAKKVEGLLRQVERFLEGFQLLARPGLGPSPREAEVGSDESDDVHGGEAEVQAR